MEMEKLKSSKNYIQIEVENEKRKVVEEKIE